MSRRIGLPGVSLREGERNRRSAALTMSKARYIGKGTGRSRNASNEASSWLGGWLVGNKEHSYSRGQTRAYFCSTHRGGSLFATSRLRGSKPTRHIALVGCVRGRRVVVELLRRHSALPLARCPQQPSWCGLHEASARAGKRLRSLQHLKHRLIVLALLNPIALPARYHYQPKDNAAYRRVDPCVLRRRSFLSVHNPLMAVRPSVVRLAIAQRATPDRGPLVATTESAQVGLGIRRRTSPNPSSGTQYSARDRGEIGLP